jgi:Ca2+/Na+ antiporter
MKKLLMTLMMLMVTVQLFAQSQDSELVKTLYSSERIYVVVACVAIILSGLLLFLFSIERRLKKLEKKSAVKN